MLNAPFIFDVYFFFFVLKFGVEIFTSGWILEFFRRFLGMSKNWELSSFLEISKSPGQNGF
jgi:hypothetical protein